MFPSLVVVIAAHTRAGACGVCSGVGRGPRPFGLLAGGGSWRPKRGGASGPSVCVAIGRRAVGGCVKWSVARRARARAGCIDLADNRGGAVLGCWVSFRAVAAVAVARQATRQLSGVLSVDEAGLAEQRELSTRGGVVSICGP